MQQLDWLELQNPPRAVLHHQVQNTSFTPRLLEQNDVIDAFTQTRILQHRVENASFPPRLLEEIGVIDAFTQTWILQHRVEHAWFPRYWRKMTLSTRSLGLKFYNTKWSYQTLGVKWRYQCVYSDLNSSTHTLLLRDERNITIGERYSISILLPQQSSPDPISISIHLHQSIFSQYLYVN